MTTELSELMVLDPARLLYLDLKTFLPCMKLKYTDKMGLAASVEVRVPLLDDELVAIAAQILSDLKLKHLRRKCIFKRSLREVRAANAEGRADNGLQLYALLALEIWHRTFLDKIWSLATAATPASVGMSA